MPAITGMDFRGMAHDIEDATGVPALGFATTGFATYERGLDLAHRELAERVRARRRRDAARRGRRTSCARPSSQADCGTAAGGNGPVRAGSLPGTARP